MRGPYASRDTGLDLVNAPPPSAAHWMTTKLRQRSVQEREKKKKEKAIFRSQ